MYAGYCKFAYVERAQTKLAKWMSLHIFVSKRMENTMKEYEWKLVIILQPLCFEKNYQNVYL